MNIQESLDKTLEELDGEQWGNAPITSHLVTECHRLRRVPLGEFGVEDLRIMIGQQFGLPHLLPLALEILEQNPFAEGDFFPGDLLLAVLGVKEEFWRQHYSFFEQLTGVISTVESRLEFVNSQVLPAWNALFTKAES